MVEFAVNMILPWLLGRHGHICASYYFVLVRLQILRHSLSAIFGPG